MAVRIKSKWAEIFLWIVIGGSLLWNLFILTFSLDPLRLIPLGLIVAAALLLYFRSIYLDSVLQLWAAYLIISSGLKLLGSYMQSTGAITYEWNEWSLFRNILFLVIAAFLLYFSFRLIDEGEVDAD